MSYLALKTTRSLTLYHKTFSEPSSEIFSLKSEMTSELEGAERGSLAFDAMDVLEPFVTTSVQRIATRWLQNEEAFKVEELGENSG